jgi:SAM-dependent methyltransferase
LHLAPETSFIEKFQRLPGVTYVSADLLSVYASVQMDITKMAWPDASFDAVYCSHVLEHVPEDRQAMREIARVLKPGGWAIIQVPVSRHHTIEDASVVEPYERERLFGQRDHVRLYGLDIQERLAAADFDVAVVFGPQFIAPHDCERMGISLHEPIFHCRKFAR